MGVKSTVQLSRNDAENRCVHLCDQLQSRAKALTNEQLANVIEALNDLMHDGEGYENYQVS